MEAVFGISLGTSSAVIAASKAGKVEVLANHVGERATPTLVAYRGNEILVGHSAKQTLHRNTNDTVSHMIALIGRDYDDVDITSLSSVMCDLVRVDNGEVTYRLTVDGKEKRVSISEALTETLKTLYETAVSYSSSEEKAAVVAVPVNHTHQQREAIRRCCVSAGFRVMRIVTEPAAICLAHGIGQNSKEEDSYVLVYDLGDHSLSLSLMQVKSGMYRVVKTSFTSSVGGRVLDTLIADFLTEEFKRQWKVSVHGNQRARYKLLLAAESAKHALSTVQTTTVHLDSLHDGIDFQCSLSRGRFEGMCSAVFRSCLEPLAPLMDSAGVAREQLDHVVLAGGSCKIPLLQQLLKREFPSSLMHSSPPPDVATATGCALQASQMGDGWRGESGRGEVVTRLPCVPHSLWIGTKDSSHQLLSSFTPIPCKKSLFLTFPRPDPPQETMCLEVKENSAGVETTIAQIFPPSSSKEEVTLKLTVLWPTDNRVTIATEDPLSDWSCTIPLYCETE